MSFNIRLRKARESAGMTQQQVADALEIDKTTYSGYETGKRSPDVERIKNIARVLKTTGDWLLETGFEQNEKPTTVSDDELSSDERLMFNEFRGLSPENRSKLIELARLFAEDQRRRKEDN